MKRIFPLFVVFLLGLAVGWLCKPAETTSEPIAKETQRSTQRVYQRPRHVVAKHHSVAADLLKASRDGTGLNEQLESIESSEFPDVLAGFKARAGIKGLDYHDMSIFEQTLLQWYKLDPNAALEWATAQENDQDRTAFLKEIIQPIAKDDFERALALSLQYLTKPDGQVDLPYGMMQAATKISGESLIHLCKLTTYKGGGAIGSGLQYPADFDFKSVLNALAGHTEALPDGMRMNQVPSNLLEEWAKRNPDEAYQWALLGKEVSFNQGIDDFIEGYSAVASARELGTFVGRVFDPEKKNYTGIKQAMIESGSEGVLFSFIENASAVLSSVEHKAGILKSLRGNSGSDPDRARQRVLGSMSAAERSRMFLESPRKFYYSENSRQRIADVLIRLGHSGGEIERMLPTVK